MKKNKITAFLAAIGIGASTLTGCSNKIDDMRSWQSTTMNELVTPMEGLWHVKKEDSLKTGKNYSNNIVRTTEGAYVIKTKNGTDEVYKNGKIYRYGDYITLDPGDESRGYLLENVTDEETGEYIEYLSRIDAETVTLNKEIPIWGVYIPKGTKGLYYDGIFYCVMYGRALVDHVGKENFEEYTNENTSEAYSETTPENMPQSTEITKISVLIGNTNYRRTAEINPENIMATLPAGTIVCKIGKNSSEYNNGNNIYTTFGEYTILNQPGSWGYIAENTINREGWLGAKVDYYMRDFSTYRTVQDTPANNVQTGNDVIVPKGTEYWDLEDGRIAYKDQNGQFQIDWATPEKAGWFFWGSRKTVGAKNVNNSALKGAQKGAQIATSILDNGEVISITNFREGMKAIITQPADTENKIPQTQKIEERE